MTHCGAESTEWEVLEVVSSSEDENYYYFTVRTPGFSEFAVAALPFEMEVEFPVQGEEADSEISGDNAGDVAEERVKSYMWLIPVIAGILGIFFFILWKRRKDEDEDEV